MKHNCNFSVVQNDTILRLDTFYFSGTSIGFKNIASKIANELKL